MLKDDRVVVLGPEDMSCDSAFKPSLIAIWVFLPAYHLKIKEEPMNKKILSFDLDGTLLNCEHQITTKTREVIKALKDMGHIIAINTGRSYDLR